MLSIEKIFLIPEHLRKTVVALTTLGRATAVDVAKITNRARAAESHYLNQLSVIGFTEKNRDGRTAYFTMTEEIEGANLMSILSQYSELSREQQEILAEDMLEAARNRIRVFQTLNKKLESIASDVFPRR